MELKKTIIMLSASLIVLLAATACESNRQKNTPEPEPSETPSFSAQNETPTPEPQITPEPSPGKPRELIISEILASNSKYCPQNGEYYDWVEIYNNSAHEIALEEYTLTDNISKPSKYIFPAKTIKAGEYMLVYCSGNTGIENQAEFKISAGETVCLFKNGELVDSVETPEDLGKNQSYGVSKGKLCFLKTPTPLAVNSEENVSITNKPVSSVASGVYDHSVVVDLTSDYEIRYTLDGSKPGKNSTLYNGPIEISKTSSIRAVSILENGVSDELKLTYIIDKSRTLPILNIATTSSRLSEIRKDLTGSDGNVEYEVLATFIENGEVKWSEACGLHLHGNDSRKMAKQNFTIKFRSKYGVGKLNYKVFDGLDVDKFDALILNGGSEDYNRAMMRDALCASIIYGQTNAVVTAIKPIVLYIAGEFWGIYFIREKVDEKYVASHYNVSEESVTIIESWHTVEAGSSAEYDALCNYVKTHDMTTDEAFNYVSEKVDLMSYIDWYICRTFLGDYDIYNVRTFKTSEGDNKWRMVFYDLDWALTSDGKKMDKTFTYYMTHVRDDIIVGLAKNKTFQEMYLARYEELVSTTLERHNILNIINEYESFMKPEVPDDRAKWGLKVESWNVYMQDLKTYFANDVRAEVIRNDIISYFASVNG